MWVDAKGSTILPMAECKRLLAVAAKDERIGRLGISTGGAPVVVPVNFALRDRHIVTRVGMGRLTRAAAGQLVAFEVDQVDLRDSTAWSVLVRGLATLIESPTEVELAEAPHPLVPEPGEMLLTVRPDIVTGRRFELRRSEPVRRRIATGRSGR